MHAHPKNNLTRLPKKTHPLKTQLQVTILPTVGKQMKNWRAIVSLRSISYNDLELDVIIDKPVGNSFDVLVVYHGTVWSDSQIHSAATMTLEKFDTVLQRDDVLIVSVGYPEENLIMGDNIIYAEAGLLWVQQRASEELDIEVKKVFLGGHSQGGYLVTHLNTMHTTDGVIANCPGPLDMRYRCQLDEDGTM